MYNFIDVNETSEESILPSEALKINGTYIEDQISGYRTLSATGREALSPDVVSYSTGIRDGSKLQSKRYPERIITVQYQLIAESNEAFREAYNQLGKILDVKDAQLIFNDEQDKFFTGTPCIIGTVEPGRNAVVGEFEILCTDPFKYSVVEHEAIVSPGESSIMVNYNGTYKAFPKLEAAFYNEEEVAADGETAGTLTGAGDCGYVAFFNEEEKIIQLGDPSEADTTGNYEKSQTLMNQTFLSETAWGTTAKNLWTVNKGHIMASNVTQQGSVAMGHATYSTSNTSGKTSGFLITKSTMYQSVTGYLRESHGQDYTLTYSTKNRKEKSVDVNITVSMMNFGTLGNDTSIVAYVTFNGTQKSITLKPKATQLKDGYEISSTVSFNVTGLTASQTYVYSENNTFHVAVTSSKQDIASGGSVAKIKLPSVPISKYSQTGYATYYLTPSAYGTASSGWHGPTITRILSPDAAGAIGATHFSLSYKQKMCISKGGSSEVGSFRMNIVDSSGKNIAGIWIYKNKSGKEGVMVFYVNGKEKNRTAIDLHYENTYFGLSESAVQTTTVSKSGGNISFAVGSYKRAFTDSALADVKATAVTFSFEKYAALTAMNYNGIYWAKFIKNNCASSKDIPNKFSANDVVVADCKDAEIYLNGIQTPGLGALGNNWESFYLKPGLNQIGVSYSDWVPAEYAPKIRVLYREVFL